MNENSILTRIDPQGVLESRTDTLKNWFEYCLNTQWLENNLTTKEYDKELKDYSINHMIETINDFSEVYELEFIKN